MNSCFSQMLCPLLVENVSKEAMLEKGFTINAEKNRYEYNGKKCFNVDGLWDCVLKKVLGEATARKGILCYLDLHQV